MFKIANKEDLCQISLTGVRSLILLGLLMQEPLSLEEIRNKFLEYNILEESHSNDILRIDLNTLRAIGCEISRAGQKTNFKYKLLKHPFDLKITKEEVNLIKRVYNKIKDGLSISTLIEYDKLFKKISEHVYDEELKQELCGISSLKHFDIDKIKELEEDCKYKRILKFTYKTPVKNKESEKEIATDKIIFKNDKIYLFGFDFISKENVMLHINRIKKILSRSDSNGNITNKSITVKLKLKNFGISGLQDNETILSGNITDGFIISGNYHNEFLAIQRILSFGTNCTVIEPDEIKEKIIDSLKKMKDIYNA